MVRLLARLALSYVEGLALATNGASSSDSDIP